ncbi:hypothetical protein HI914_05889 [Erysiphe necator]|nr:hypothetical protein HI914_05889 [Erysiphe necator]
MASNNTEAYTPELQECINNTLKFLHDLRELEATNLGTNITSNHENALNIAYETADLIRAQATKISLLVLNAPLNPSTLVKALHELTTSLIPSLVYAVNLCKPSVYSQLFSEEIKYRATRIIVAFKSLIEAIPYKNQSLNDQCPEGKIFLAKTGTIWESCDAIKLLKTDGISGFFIRMTQDYMDLIKDASEELQDWAKEEGFHEIHNSRKEEIPENNAFHVGTDSSAVIPKCISNNNEDGIWQRFQVTQKKLRLLVIMFQAIIKRRLKTLPSLPNSQSGMNSNDESDRINIVDNLDQLLSYTKALSNSTDLLASSFYSLDIEKVDQDMEECFSLGFRIAEIVIKNWEGKSDSFSAWASFNLLIATNCMTS